MASFELGQLLATPGVLAAAEGEDLLPYLSRHARGDWGTVNAADKRANESALKEGTRLLSAYTLRDGTTRIYKCTSVPPAGSPPPACRYKRKVFSQIFQVRNVAQRRGA